MPYSNTSMWDLDKRCQRTFLQGRNRHTDVDGGLADTGREGGELRGALTCTRYCAWDGQLVGGLWAAQGAHCGAVMTWAGRAGRPTRQGHVDTYSHVTLSYSRS